MSDVTLSSSGIDGQGQDEEVIQKSEEICFTALLRFLLFLDVGRGGSHLMLE
jgi:hypothetical protein